jgi:ABC-2 type transport system permease protein
MMHGFLVFLGKEGREIVRTWRIWVLPLIVVGMAVLSPVTAELTPALLESVAGDQPGVVFEIPEPQTIDAYLQWTKNLTQIVLIAIVVSMAGTVSGERKAGTAVLVLTKPLSRAGMVIAKWVSNSLLVICSTVAGAAVCWLGTQLFFDDALTRELIGATALWLVLALVFVAVITLLSASLDSQAGVAGVGLVVYLVLVILSGWGPARDHTFAGLVGAPNAVLAGEDITLTWMLVTALAAIVLAMAGAVAVFGRREL